MRLAELSMYHDVKVFSKTEKKFYFVYARKSSESEDRQVESIGDQLGWVEEVKQKRNISTTETFSESKSAKMPGRSEFNRMIELIYKRHDIKGIICWKLNRLTRNPVDEGTIRWLLQSGEIEEIITSDRTYVIGDSDFNMAIEGSQAQRFITDLRKDTARGTKNKLDKGIAPILAPPGYINDKTKKQGERDILPHPIQFSLVRKLFDLELSGNYSVQQLWLKAKELGIRSNRGKVTSRTQLYQLLRNPFYTGARFIYAGKLYTNGIHKRMITDEEYDLVQDILSKRTNPRGQTHTDLLSGVMTCGECGRGIVGRVRTKQYKNGTSQTFVYYRCSRNRILEKCTQPPIRADILEKQVSEYLEKVELSPKFVQWAIKFLGLMHNQQDKLREAKLQATRQSYDEVQKKISRLVDLMISGVINTEEGSVKKQTLEMERTMLQANLMKIDKHVSDWSTLAIETFKFLQVAKDKFKTGTVEQKKNILRVLGSELILKDRKLDIQTRTPFKYVQDVAMELKQIKTSDQEADGLAYSNLG